jgi:hypothetical protein
VISIRELHVSTLAKVNDNENVLDLIYKQASMKEVMNLFWDNVKATVIIKTPDKAVVVYGYNSDTCKYYGMFDSIQSNVSV